MSMETYAIVFIKPDDEFNMMKSIWDNCMELRIEIPLKVINYFKDCEPGKNGIEVKIPSHQWDNGDMDFGIDVYINEIPDKVNTVRFINSR